MRRLLGKKLRGCLCSDRYSVYARYPKRQRGLCWSHLKRDSQGWVDRGGESAKVGWEALAVTGEVFERWRRFKRRRLSRPQLKRALRPLRRQLKGVLERGLACGHPRTARTCRRLLELWGASSTVTPKKISESCCIAETPKVANPPGA